MQCYISTVQIYTMFYKTAICSILIATTVLARDYTVKYDKFELASYEKAVISVPKVEFDPATQTMNASIYLWISVNDPVKMMQGSAEFFIKEGDNYVATGLRMKKNLCFLWNQDVNGFKTKIEKYGNVNFCSWEKGDIYVRNYALDDTLFPNHLKPGQYKVILSGVLYTMHELMSFVAYLQVIPKNV